MRESTAAAAATAFTSSPLMPVPGDSTDMRAWGLQMRYEAVSLPRTCEIVGRRVTPVQVEDSRMNTRRLLENASAKPIAFLHQMPAWLAPMVITGLFVAGAFAAGWIGPVALCLVAAFIAWLASLSWPALRLPGLAQHGAQMCGLEIAATQFA